MQKRRCMYFGCGILVSGLGRFLSQDPLGSLAAPNLYEFGNSSPVSELDPYGLQSSCGSLDPATQVAIALAAAQAELQALLIGLRAALLAVGWWNWAVAAAIAAAILYIINGFAKCSAGQRNALRGQPLLPKPSHRGRAHPCTLQIRPPMWEPAKIGTSKDFVRSVISRLLSVLLRGASLHSFSRSLRACRILVRIFARPDSRS